MVYPHCSLVAMYSNLHVIIISVIKITVEGNPVFHKLPCLKFAALYSPYRGSDFRSSPRECVSLRSILPTEVKIFVALLGNVCRRALSSLQRFRFS